MSFELLDGLQLGRPARDVPYPTSSSYSLARRASLRNTAGSSPAAPAAPTRKSSEMPNAIRWSSNSRAVLEAALAGGQRGGGEHGRPCQRRRNKFGREKEEHGREEGAEESKWDPIDLAGVKWVV